MGSLTTTITTADVAPRPKEGLLYVGARFTNPDLPYPDFARWYDEIHMPHLVSMQGCRAAMRYARVTEPNPSSSPSATQYSSAMPYATLYPLHDVSWLHGAEFDSAKESTEAEYLPGRSVFKSVEFEGRGYEVVGESAGMGGGEGGGATKFIVFTTYKPPSTASTHAAADAASMDAFYAAVSALPGCRGLTRYRFSDVQRPELAARFEASGRWPAREAAVHGLDVGRGDLGVVYRARDAVVRGLEDPSALEVAVYELLTGLDG
ncbi:hypothetical protein PMIN04_012948 [Paraphaeosphaeria minitans]